MSETPFYLIYRICSPDTLDCVWVGLTKNPGFRFTHHLHTEEDSSYERSIEKVRWVKRLAEQGKRPIFIIEDWTISVNAARMKEAKVMNRMLKEGHKLFNAWVDIRYTPQDKRPIKDSTGRVFESVSEAARQTGCSRTMIKENLAGKCAQTGGLTFSWATHKDLVEAPNV